MFQNIHVYKSSFLGIMVITIMIKAVNFSWPKSQKIIAYIEKFVVSSFNSSML